LVATSINAAARGSDPWTPADVISG